MRRIICLTILLFATTLFASEPGKPIDCSDWVSLEPGLTCVPWFQYPCDPTVSQACRPPGSPDAVDNSGRFFYWKLEVLPGEPVCPATGQPPTRHVLVAFDGISPRDLGYIPISRCNATNTAGDRFAFANHQEFLFQEEVGRLILGSGESCSVGGVDDYACLPWVPSIEGFTTTFDVLQSFSPVADQLEFRVPYLPEGFPAADSFDAYWGELATVGDWSQAQSLACAFPVSIPNPGNHVAVPEPLGDPSPGAGFYFVTATSYQGERRYGRRSAGGVLVGRDPAVLPACE